MREVPPLLRALYPHTDPYGRPVMTERPWWVRVDLPAGEPPRVVRWYGGRQCSPLLPFDPHDDTEIERWDQLHPLPPPPPVVGQVWASEGAHSEAGPEPYPGEWLLTYVDQDGGGRTAVLGPVGIRVPPMDWPPRDLFLVAGPWAPWAPMERQDEQRRALGRVDGARGNPERSTDFAYLVGHREKLHLLEGVRGFHGVSDPETEEALAELGEG